MLTRDVTGAAAVTKTTDDASRALIQRRAIRRFFGQPLLDIPSDNLGERQTTLASLGPQSPGLLLGQLNLRSDHRRECKHIMM